MLRLCGAILGVWLSTRKFRCPRSFAAIRAIHRVAWASRAALHCEGRFATTRSQDGESVVATQRSRAHEARDKRARRSAAPPATPGTMVPIEARTCDEAAWVAPVGFGQHECRDARVLADFRQPLRRRTSLGWRSGRPTCAGFLLRYLRAARRSPVSVAADVSASYRALFWRASGLRGKRVVVHKKVSLSTMIRRVPPFPQRYAPRYAATTSRLVASSGPLPCSAMRPRSIT